MLLSKGGIVTTMPDNPIPMCKEYIYIQNRLSVWLDKYNIVFANWHQQQSTTISFIFTMHSPHIYATEFVWRSCILDVRYYVNWHISVPSTAYIRNNGNYHGLGLTNNEFNVRPVSVCIELPIKIGAVQTDSTTGKKLRPNPAI